jgi:hypothetical protein
MRHLMRPLILIALVTALVTAVSCGGDDGDANLPFGATTVVIVVNPQPNEGNTAALPAFVGTEVENIDIDARPGGAATTDDTGLAVLDELDAGELDLFFAGDVALALTIASRGDVYDVAVAHDGADVALYPGFPIQYGVGGDIVVIGTDVDATEALNTDDTIVFFEDGVHVGDLVIEGSNVILFADSFEGDPVVIDGSVEVRGGSVRLRGVTITGDLTVFGNEFGMSFSTVHGAVQLNGQALSFLRNVFCQGATVPSSNAALYDNAGLPPFPTPAAPICP